MKPFQANKVSRLIRIVFSIVLSLAAGAFCLADTHPCSKCPNGDELVETLEDGTPVYKCACDITAPRLIHRKDPKYPKEARRNGVSGTVTLSAIVDTKGSVREVTVARSLEPSLDKAAVAALNEWKFQPATKDGKPVGVQVQIEVSFRLYGKLAAP